jgi:hypothetical protein
MKVLQIYKRGLPTEVMELGDISEPDAPKAGGLPSAGPSDGGSAVWQSRPGEVIDGDDDGCD